METQNRKMISIIEKQNYVGHSDPFKIEDLYYTNLIRNTTETELVDTKKIVDENSLLALINNTSDLIWSIDKNGILITSNNAFNEMLKFMSGKEKIDGGNLGDGFSNHQLVRWQRFYERAFCGEIFSIIEYTDTPMEIWSEISFNPIRKANEIIGIACHSRNITNIKKAEAEIIKLNESLEERVIQRTSELVKANISLEEETQKLLSASNIIEQKNKDITDSLNYAKVIQNATVNKKGTLVKHFPDSFILTMPLQIVSGDFVRVDEKKGVVLVALADCTGHGIPGALMSMIGYSFFNDAINYKKKTTPSVILNSLDSDLKNLTKEASGMNDGMDVGFCSVDTNKMEIEFAGAHRPLYIIRENNLIEIKGDNLSIGGQTNEKKKYTSHKLKLQKNDSLYMFSDGYIDQFGGENGKKFSSKRLKETLLSIQHLTMKEQREYLKQTICEWKGELEQVDDISLLGFRI